MKQFPKTIYVTRVVNEPDDPDEYFVETNKEFVKEEEADTEVAVYKLVKVGSVVKSSKIVFDKE